MTAPLRVAHFLHSALSGGERVVLRLLSAFDRGSVEPLVVLPADGPLRAELDGLAVRTRVLPMSWWVPGTHWTAGEFRAQLEGLEARAHQAAALLREERVDLVHTHFVPTLEGALAAARTGLPHVWHSRGLFGGGFPPPWFDDVPFLLSVVDQLSDAIICVSRRVQEQAALGGEHARRHVVYDGFDRAAFLVRPVPEVSVLRERYRLHADARVVACVGGIQRRKGQMDLVETAVLLARAVPALVFALAGAAGDEDYLRALQARIDAAGVGRHFRLLGFQPEVRDLFAVSQALVHPSHSEGWGLAILEAMAAGLPVVATRSGGPEEILEDGVSGLLVPVGDPPSLAAALRRVLLEGDAASAMGQAGRERAGAFTLAATARRTQDVYGEVLANAAAGQQGRAARADSLAAQVLSRARAAAAAPPEGPPPAPRNPPRGSWLSRLRRRRS
jgi:glycosyltransferase involved in cell wall biosynthesis